MKKLVIMRGVPGSGKSTVAMSLQADVFKSGMTCTIRSTDSQFMVGEAYVFNPRLLGANHEKNIRLVQSDMVNETNVIIVDNTNIKVEHFRPYLDLAKQYKYDVEVKNVIVATNNIIDFDDYVNICAARNNHGVSAATIKRMLMSWEPFEVCE